MSRECPYRAEAIPADALLQHQAELDEQTRQFPDLVGKARTALVSGKLNDASLYLASAQIRLDGLRGKFAHGGRSFNLGFRIALAPVRPR
jgi:hypothetical protein